MTDRTRLDYQYSAIKKGSGTKFTFVPDPFSNRIKVLIHCNFEPLRLHQ